ncbi:MAG: peptide deformylase [Prevotellaceae bacterium]|jgi:peptide deformylase|nr:peptide deformylase [Prevotellaceae bacterium]
MILPVYTYGSAVLRKKSEPIDSGYPNIKELIDNMFETMHSASGVGLAAPQIGLPIRVLVIDFAQIEDKTDPELSKFRVAMINPRMLYMSEETSVEEEGCLSIPGINENVARSKHIKIKYLDTDFNEHTEDFSDYRARAIQHEYDHLEGKLFTDKVSQLRRQLIKSKLNNIVKGKVNCKYRVSK